MQERVNRANATYQDIIDLDPRYVGEIINGELVVHPRPAPAHVRSSGRLHTLLDDSFDLGRSGPGGWVIRNEPELHLPGRQIVVPDHAGWRRETWAGEPTIAFFEQAPDWACEWLSPSTAAYDRAEKLEIYAENGIRHYWIADALLETIEVYELSDGRYRHLTTAKGKQPVALPPFEVVPLDLAMLWTP